MGNTELRTLELINLDIDGQLDDAGRAELAALLAADPVARERHAQLQKLMQMLAVAPVPDLPFGFTETVVRKAQWSKLGRTRAAGIRSRRLVYALAASAALVVLGLQVLDLGPQGQMEQLAGTLARPADSPVGASVEARPVAGGLLMTFELPPGPLADLVIDFTASGRQKEHLVATMDRPDAAGTPRVEGRRIVVPGVGGGKFSLRVQGPVSPEEFAAALVRDGVSSPVIRTGAADRSRNR
jgi:anti-sigma factor RsiW